MRCTCTSFLCGILFLPTETCRFGTHDMGTEDLNEYFAEFNPGHVEWYGGC